MQRGTGRLSTAAPSLGVVLFAAFIATILLQRVQQHKTILTGRNRRRAIATWRKPCGHSDPFVITVGSRDGWHVHAQHNACCPADKSQPRQCNANESRSVAVLSSRDIATTTTATTETMRETSSTLHCFAIVCRNGIVGGTVAVESSVMACGYERIGCRSSGEFHQCRHIPHAR